MVRAPAVALRLAAIALAAALLACCRDGAATASSTATVGEAQALAEAGEMLDERRVPLAEVEPSPTPSGARAER